MLNYQEDHTICGNPLAYAIHSAWAEHYTSTGSIVLSVIAKALAHYNIRATFQIDDSVAQELHADGIDAEHCPVVNGPFMCLLPTEDQIPYGQGQQDHQGLQVLQDAQDQQDIQVKMEEQEAAFEIMPTNAAAWSLCP
ncbi:predicted protein [Lichtheimia corymbifera JMRC:FSU:9682]|uniref:Uncharacterized protein n=1 Tax=Lichtheimia corymbifera JMRC:FSU:9682 TaxID=1263082 RepID=A0A068SH78_9FUNG|nr:predicted protein [Lichtheimia corymbifera JMRC:FSU:9682]